MIKKIIKFILDKFKLPVVKIFACLFGIFFVLYLWGVFEVGTPLKDTFREILKNDITLSVFFVALGSLGIKEILKIADRHLEESNKTADDHHKIIRKYELHIKDRPNKDDTSSSGAAPDNGNISDIRDGFDNKDFLDGLETTMEIKKTTKHAVFNKKITDMDDKDVRESIDKFENREGLRIASVNSFVNSGTDSRLSIVFNDHRDVHQLPDFVMNNAITLMNAHKNSLRSNNDTIRLKKAYLEGDTLHFDTERSTYFHMLITNRCMDYDLGNGLTLREIYEYRRLVTPLERSVLGNQIGINGMVVTSDGYCLIEKRDNKKSTWKNKFAQPISLALKEKELYDIYKEEHEAARKGGQADHQELKTVNVTVDGKPTLEDSPEASRKLFEKVVRSTLKKHFPVYQTKKEKKENKGKKAQPSMSFDFSINNNFLGLARDLLEGGKPNLYFAVVTNEDSKELAKNISGNWGRFFNAYRGTDGSDWYLVKFEDIKIGYDYTLRINPFKCKKICRKRKHALTSYLSCISYNIRTLFFIPFKRECGEALLATISYLETCHGRMDATLEGIKEKRAAEAEKAKEEKRKRRKSRLIQLGK